METLIDRPARTAMAEALRHLAAGRISNDQFVERLGLASRDAAVTEIHLNGAWYLYDDTREHRLTGRQRLDGEARHEVARWILFLKTDLEYEWPSLRGLRWMLLLLLSAVTLGAAGALYRRRMRRAGDIEVWPFLRRQDYEAALAQPPYLTGWKCRPPVLSH